MHEYLLSEQTKRLERNLNWIGALVAIPSLVVGFLNINLVGLTTKNEGLAPLLALSIVVLSLVASFAFWKWLER
jgi:ABC-type phosphate transport system permease subunit